MLLLVIRLHFLLNHWHHGSPLSLIDQPIQSRGNTEETLAHDKISYLIY